uniref:U10-Theriditoxin-Lha1d_1 n=1 Tax=Latrodectus hasselti TaxID=256736 RepID=A0A482Z8G1_LATHA
MNFVYIFLAAVVVFFRLISAKDIGLDSEKDETPNSPFFLEEEARSDECTPLTHDCTHDRHSCCRGPTFKYKCDCLYPFDNSTSTWDQNELCFCIEPGVHHFFDEVMEQKPNNGTNF